MSIDRIKMMFATVITLMVWAVCGCNAQQRQVHPRPQHIVILGDSNIWLAGDSCNQPKGWMTWFNRAMAPETCRSYARSGATWSHTPNTQKNIVEDIAILGDNNVIYNQVLRLMNAVANGEQHTPTLILVSSGGNDAWFADKREHEFDQTVDEAFAMSDETLLTQQPHEVLSLPGAIRLSVLTLRLVFPDADIVLVTPTPMSKVEPEMLTKVSDIIDLTGQRLGVPTLRLDLDSPIDRDVELREHVNTYDGIHTNEIGAQRVGEYAAEKVKALLGDKTPVDGSGPERPSSQCNVDSCKCCKCAKEI